MNQNLSNQLWLPGSSSDNILLCDTKTNTHIHRAHQREDKHQWTLTHLHTHTLFMCSLTETHLQRSLSLKWPIGLQWEHRGVDQSEEMPLYSSHFPSPQVIFSLFLWMFSPLEQLSCLSPLLCSPLGLIWQTRVREKSQRCTGHTSRCQAKTAALVEISFLLQVVWKINLQKISGNLLIKC